MGSNTEAKIRLTAEDATSGAFATAIKNVRNLGSEAAALPSKFTQIAIASAGVGSLAGFAGMISGVIEGRAHLRDLSVETNISVEALSSLNKVAKYTPTSIDDIAAASGKLSKSLFSQTEDSKGAAQAISALGLNFDKFKSLAPDQQLYEIAKALDRFQDGSEKSAVAMLLFGKAGTQMLPFLRELSERGLEAAKVTTAQAEEAKRYEDNLRSLKAAGEEWKKALTDDMLPSLLEFSRELVAGRQAYGTWFGAIVSLGSTNPFNDLGANITKARDDFHSLNEEMDRSKAGKLTRPQSVIESELADASKRYDYFLRLQRMQAGDLSRGIYEDPRLRTAKPKLSLPAANQNPDAADALLRRIAQGEVDAAKSTFEKEKELLDFRSKILKADYDAGLEALADYFAKQARIREDGLAAELGTIDKEIAAQTKLRDNPAVKPETQQAAANAVAKLEAQRALVVQKGAHDNALALKDEERQVKQTEAAYYDFLATIETLKGNSQKAFELSLPKRLDDARLHYKRIGMSDEEAGAQVKNLEDLLRSTDALNRAQVDYSVLTESLGVKEKGIQLDAQLRGDAELDTLRAIGAERQKQLPLLQALAENAQAEAEAVRSPAAILAAQKLALVFRQAQAEADPVFMKIRDIGKEFGDAVASDAEDAILHWQGVRHLLLQIEQDILRIAIRRSFTEPLGNYLSNLIGGNGTAAGGGGLLGGAFAKLFNFGGSSTGVQPGEWGTGSAFGNLDFGGFFADGGTLKPGQWGIAGENGPEPIYAGATPLHVTPAGGSGPSIVIHQSFAPGTDRRTVDQAGLSAGMAVQRAMRRNG